MHEFSVIASALEIVQQEVLKNKATVVKQVTLRYGVLSNVVPDLLNYAFASIVKNPEASGYALEEVDFSQAVLILDAVPVLLQCGHCGKEFCPKGKGQEAVFEACDYCGKALCHKVLQGDVLQVVHIEAE